VIITARNPDRLHQAGLELGASIAAFDTTDFDRLRRFFDELPTPIDHVLVTGPGPYYAPFAEFDIGGHQVTATTTSPGKLGLLEQLGAKGTVMDGLDAAAVGEAVAAADRTRS
jgi:hypothetical protein